MEKRLDNGTVFFMVLTAILIDLVQVFLGFIIIGEILDPLIDVVAMFLFGIWFSHHGIKVTGSKNIGAFLITGIIGFVPIVDMLPEWTIFVVRTVIKNRKNAAAAQSQQSEEQNKPWRL
jgi:hypothetical protein